MTQGISVTGPLPALLAALNGQGPLGPVGEGLRALVAVWCSTADATDAAGAAGAMGSAGPGSCPADDATDVMSDDQLVDSLKAIARLERSIEALKLQCSSAIARRSVGESRHEGLAGRHGFATPERFIASATGASTADAAKLVAVAAATTEPKSFGGASSGPRYPLIAAAIATGSISIEVAHRIAVFLDSLRLSVDAPRLQSAERQLLERAQVIGIDGLNRYFKLVRAQLDEKRVQAREEELHAQRSLRIWEDRHGLIHLRGCLDPATAAPIKLAIDTLVSADLHAARDAKSRLAARMAGAGGSEPGARRDAADAPESTDTGVVAAMTPAADAADRALIDDRTIVQMAADALADIARLAASATDAPPALASASVVVRIDRDSLMSPTGFATVDDIEEPVSAATARGIAASAGIIPMIVGGAGEVLDLGRRQRFFTKAQRIALAERDGGCAHPDCARPIAHTQAHHIRWWDAHDGPTDLDNGVLLCAFRHWCVHHDGWQIFTRDGRTWFVPPPHLDPEQRPRPGRRAARLELKVA